MFVFDPKGGWCLRAARLLFARCECADCLRGIEGGEEDDDEAASHGRMVPRAATELISLSVAVLRNMEQPMPGQHIRSSILRNPSNWRGRVAIVDEWTRNPSMAFVLNAVLQ
jgi:hypothetical protein